MTNTSTASISARFCEKSLSRGRYIGVLAAVLALTGCASQVMGQYIGKDVREVALTYGPPSHAFDLADGRRIFQWISTSTVSVSGQSTSTSTVTSTGKSAWMTTNTQITPPQTITSTDVCSYIATWDGDAAAWIVSDVEIPRGLVVSCF